MNILDLVSLSWYIPDIYLEPGDHLGKKLFSATHWINSACNWTKTHLSKCQCHDFSINQTFHWLSWRCVLHTESCNGPSPALLLICGAGSLQHKVYLSLLPWQEGVGSASVPAPCCAVQHEGEKHQESSDSHPQNQPEPGSPREEGELRPPLLLLPLFCLLRPSSKTSETGRRARIPLQPLLQFPKIGPPD